MDKWPHKIRKAAFIAGWGVIGIGCIVLLAAIPVFLLVDDLILVVVILEMGGLTITNGVLLLIISYLIRD